MLNAENVSAYGDGGAWGRVCKFVSGIWQCVQELVDPEPEPEPTHYTKTNQSCHRGRDPQGNPLTGNQEVCIEQQGSGANQCSPGWTGPCL